MIGRRSEQQIKDKCERLERLGFEILHEDSRVMAFNGLEIDFSATANDDVSLMKVAMLALYKQGYNNGKQWTQDKIKDALGILE